MLEVCAAVETVDGSRGGRGVLEVCAAVETVDGGGRGGGGGGRVEELATAVCIVLPPLPPLSPSLYGGRRGRAAKENLLVLASQQAVPPDNSGRLESQQ